MSDTSIHGPQIAALVVEDDDSWRMLYEEILRDEGCIIEIASKKDDALAKLKARFFDIAIVDIRLDDQDPGNMDGIDIFVELRTMYRDTKVVVNSGYLTSEILGRIRDMGAFGILEKKEARGDQLVDLLRKALSRTDDQRLSRAF